MVDDVSKGMDFVVEVDRRKAERNKASALRAYTWLAFVSAGLAGAAGALAVAVVTETATDGMSAGHTSALLRIGLFVMVIAVAMAGLWFRTVQQARRIAGPNDVALRLTARGVHTGMAGEPDVIFVPWALVAAFDERRVGPRRTHLLVLRLAPGASASTGAVGLERPDVQRMVRLLGGIAWPVDVLRQPPSAIAAAHARLAPTR
jgi:hypothetical protein